jgi:hypothetical protein
MESNPLIQALNVSKKALIVEKWCFSFLLMISIHLPLLMIQELPVFLIGISIFHCCFIIGFIQFIIKKS